ncbi:MAG: hypothetical protein HAW67_01965 [Endozoicomonadaceae bacterium]|nr:hypothetical protein [Endozoicomonadaceae bacterium]
MCKCSKGGAKYFYYGTALPKRGSNRHMLGKNLGKQEAMLSLKSHAKIFQNVDYAA